MVMPAIWRQDKTTMTAWHLQSCQPYCFWQNSFTFCVNSCNPTRHSWNPTFDRIIKNSTFLVTKWIISSSKCAKTWLAGAPLLAPLEELAMLPRPHGQLGEGHPVPIPLPSNSAPLVPRTWHCLALRLIPLSVWKVGMTAFFWDKVNNYGGWFSPTSAWLLYQVSETFSMVSLSYHVHGVVMCWHSRNICETQFPF